MATRSYKDLSADEFKRLMKDIGKEHHFDECDDVKEGFVMTNPPKKTGFYGYKNGEVRKEWPFNMLLKNVKVCDWLDYYGYDRPKWKP